MPLTREQKATALDEIVAKLQETPTLYLTNYSGLTVAQANDLRGRFRKEGIEYKVLKNTLLRLAMDRLGGYQELYEQLNGPTAVAFSEDPAAPARVIKKFLQDNPTSQVPGLKGAYIDGAIYGDDALEVLSSLKSKGELLGDIIGLLLAPASNVIGALQAQGSNIVGALKTIAEREGEAG